MWGVVLVWAVEIARGGCRKECSVKLLGGEVSVSLETASGEVPMLQM